jgi:hypothetical protein
MKFAAIWLYKVSYLFSEIEQITKHFLGDRSIFHDLVVDECTTLGAIEKDLRNVSEVAEEVVKKLRVYLFVVKALNAE